MLVYQRVHPVSSSVWTVWTSSLDDSSCRMLGFFIHSIQRRAVICPTTCAAVSTSTSLRAEPLSLFDVCGKAKELYQQLPDWVRPGSVATCLAFWAAGIYWVYWLQHRQSFSLSCARHWNPEGSAVKEIRHRTVFRGVLVVNKPASRAACADQRCLFQNTPGWRASEDF